MNTKRVQGPRSRVDDGQWQYFFRADLGCRAFNSRICGFPVWQVQYLAPYFAGESSLVCRENLDQLLTR